MIWLALGRWSSAHGFWFTRVRLYWRGWRWTPLVIVFPRYALRPAILWGPPIGPPMDLAE